MGCLACVGLCTSRNCSLHLADCCFSTMESSSVRNGSSCVRSCLLTRLNLMKRIKMRHSYSQDKLRQTTRKTALVRQQAAVCVLCCTVGESCQMTCQMQGGRQQQQHNARCSLYHLHDRTELPCALVHPWIWMNTVITVARVRGKMLKMVSCLCQSSAHHLTQFKSATVDYSIIHLCMCNTKHFTYISLPLGN